MNPADQLKKTQEQYQTLRTEIRKVIIGQDAAIEALLLAFFSRGHALLVGVPGLAKTLMIQTLANAMDLTFRRIQFTPDLMPSDITGTEVIEEDLSTGKRAFRFIKGPVFGNIILADEINRTPPKTQSALLEAMQEYQVTSAGERYSLEKPFFVLATQNPIEQEGTYPLPEAQLDRFMFQINIDYPALEEEYQIIRATTSDSDYKIEKVLQRNDLTDIQHFVREIPVADHIIEYAVQLVRNTRPEETSYSNIKKYVKWGAGPRAAQYLIIGAKARAALYGRATPDEDDIRAIAENVLRHRILLNFNAEAEDVPLASIIKELLTK